MIDTTFLASEINDAPQGTFEGGINAYLEAKRAEIALLAAKKTVRHGEFKAWVEANCRDRSPGRKASYFLKRQQFWVVCRTIF